jgi:hypothetical protein
LIYRHDICNTRLLASGSPPRVRLTSLGGCARSSSTARRITTPFRRAGAVARREHNQPVERRRDLLVPLTRTSCNDTEVLLRACAGLSEPLLSDNRPLVVWVFKFAVRSLLLWRLASHLWAPKCPPWKMLRVVLSGVRTKKGWNTKFKIDRASEAPIMRRTATTPFSALSPSTTAGDGRTQFALHPPV